MIKNMQLSISGYIFIKQWEGERLSAYQDPAGIWTIGVGHTGLVDGRRITAGMRITAVQSQRLLIEDIHSHTRTMKDVIHTPLTQSQFDALASFCFNLGPNIITDPLLLQAINQQQWPQVEEQLMRYVYAGGQLLTGLVKRRQAECTLFSTGLSTHKWITEKGRFQLNDAIHLRQQASLSSPIIATLKAGDLVVYDAYHIDKNGYVWLRQPRPETYGYLASGESKNHKRISYWGKFL